MACCPIPVINSCKCIHLAPARFRPSYPAYSNIRSAPCFSRPVFPADPYGGFNWCPRPLFPASPYGGYLSQPWETLCGRHPFQGDYKQIIYNLEVISTAKRNIFIKLNQSDSWYECLDFFRQASNMLCTKHVFNTEYSSRPVWKFTKTTRIYKNKCVQNVPFKYK